MEQAVPAGEEIQNYTQFCSLSAVHKYRSGNFQLLNGVLI
jgi:hypothetical protein